MNKRSTTILLAILNSSQSSINYDTLCSLFKVSERTIRNDINEINGWLSNHNFSNLKVDNNGFLVVSNKKDVNKIKKTLLSLDTYDYRLLKEERRAIISVVLLSTSKTASIKDLCEKTSASRATVLADIAAMKDDDSNKSIKIETAVGKGIVSNLSDSEKLELLIEIINDNMANYHIHNVFINILLNLIEGSISFGEVVKKLQKINIVKKYHLSDEGFRKTSIFLFVILNCSFDCKQSSEVTKDKKVCDYADEIFNLFKKYINAFNIEKKKEYFIEYFSLNNPFTIIDAQKDSPEVIAIVAEFLRRVSSDLNEDLYKDYVLFEFLCSHITSLVERIKNNINEHYQEEYDISEIVKKYPVILKSVNNQIKVIENFFSISLDDNDKAYIVMYIQATIYRNSNDSRVNNVLIACPGSLATGELLAAQVKKYFNYNIVDVTSVDNINNYQKEDVDFVLSTVLIPFCIWPVMTVSPVLHVIDITKIHTVAYEIYKKNKGKKNNTSVNCSQNNSNKKEVSLLDLLDEEKIEFCDEKIDVLDSIRKSGEILVKNNCIEANYIERIIKAFNEYGPYFVITKGAVLLHAKSNNENKKTAMSLLICRKGVEYGVDLLDPIKLIFCFSYSEAGDYLMSLNQLVEIGKNQKTVDLISNANGKRQVIDIIKSHLKT